MFTRSPFHQRQFTRARLVALCVSLLVAAVAMSNATAYHGQANSQQLAVGISLQDGIVLMETDDTFVFGDRPLPIASLTTFRLVPNAQNSFDVMAMPFSYENDIGRLVVDRFQQEDYVETSLGFDFPLAGQTYKTMRVSGHGGAVFGLISQPSGVLPQGFDTERQYELFDAVSDKTPRLCPLFAAPIHGLSGGVQSTPTQRTYKYTSAYAKTESGKATFTWQGVGTDATAFAPIEFQMVLHQSGEVLFSYKDIRGIKNGAVMAVTGREPWWGSSRTVAEVNNALAATSNRLESAQLFQIGDTNVLMARFQTPTPLPMTSSSAIQFGLGFKDASSGNQIGWAIARLDSSGWGAVLTRSVRGLALSSTIRTKNIQVSGNSLTITIPLEEIVPLGSPFTVKFFLDNPYVELPVNQTIQLNSSRDIRTDFTALPFTGSSRPLIAVYTLPSVDGVALGNRVQRVLGNNIDALMILPTFDNGDGSYGSGGNAGVEGIGTANSQSPVTPDNVIIGNLPQTPTDLYFISNWVQHGFGHRWLYYISIMENGVKTNSLNPNGYHPGFNVHTPAAFPINSPSNASAMGGNYWRENDDGTFSIVHETPANHIGFSWLELYLFSFHIKTKTSI